MTEQIIIVAGGDTVYLYHPTQANQAHTVHHMMIGANLHASIRTLPTARWEQVQAQLREQGDIRILDMQPTAAWRHPNPPAGANQHPDRPHPAVEPDATRSADQPNDTAPDLSGFNTPLHHAVQAACRHIIH
jgi:hypothetical protein